MTAVSGKEGIRYGINLLGWICLIGVIGGGIAGVGFIIAGGGLGTLGTVIGGILFLVGVLVAISGAVGLLYKVIADAINRTG